MDDFSWTDSIRATVTTCLPCFSSRTSHESESEQERTDTLSSRRGHQTRYEELEGLLRNDPSDTDGGDAETMSLHSNLGIGGEGRRKRNRKKRRNRKSIQIFGFHLFGRPPIQLSDSEHDEGEDDNGGSRRRHRSNRPGRLAISRVDSAHSSSSADAETFGAFDSDASPLDPALISQLSPQDAAARAERAAAEREAEEARRKQQQLEKEERRRRRRERKEMERRAAMGAAAGGAATSMDGDEFEGFPGSGSLRAPSLKSPLSPGSVSSAPTSPPALVDEFGPYVGAAPLPQLVNSSQPVVRTDYGDNLPEGEDEPDFGGEAYNRKARHSSSRGSRGSDSSRSHSQSQTTSSSHYYYPYAQQQHPQQQEHRMYFAQYQGSPIPSPNNPAFFVQQVNPTAMQAPGALVNPCAAQPQPPKKKKSKSKRSSNSTTTGTTGTASTSSRSPTSQSASLPSLDATSTIVPTFVSDASPSSGHAHLEPKIVEHDDEGSALRSSSPRVIIPADASLSTANGVNASGFDASSKFPTIGFGGARRTNSSGTTSGAFLARRGDD